MKQIHPVLYLWAVFFYIFPAKGYSQNILRSFQLTISATFAKTATPQSIDLDKLTSPPNSVIALFELKDGKKQPIAAQIEKKRKHALHWMVVSEVAIKSAHSNEIIKKNNPLAASNMPAGIVPRNNNSPELQACGKPWFISLLVC